MPLLVFSFGLPLRSPTTETGNQILNTYDAAGIKLKSEVVENGVSLRTTYYKNGFIYEQKSTDPALALAFFGTAEGRIVKKESKFVYEYHYKDHLGNLRVAFQAEEASEKEKFELTMENEKASEEEKQFENVAAAHTDLKDKEGHYSAALENSKQAISKTLKVKKGDKITASVFATYDPEIATTDPTKAIQDAKKDVLVSLGGVVAGSINTNPTRQEIELAGVPEVSPATTQTIEPPKVQLNLLDFIPVIRNLRALNRAKKAKGLEPDTYFVPKGELVLELRDSTDSLIFEKREKLTISSASSWEKLVSDLEVSQDGKLSVYIDNSSSDKVYFDEFTIEKTEATKAVIVQENHYYPFGMNMKGIEELDLQSLTSKDEHRFQYNGKEKEESFGLYWNDHGARNLDLQLGRWWGVDPLAEKFVSTSSYVAMINNPIRFVDLDGRLAGDFLDDKGNIIGNDGKDDKKLYVIKTKEKEFVALNGSVTKAAGLSKKEVKATEAFIKANSGNSKAFDDEDNIAYKNSIEIEGSKEVRQQMADVVMQDDGKGGESDENNREYGGTTTLNGEVLQAEAGDVTSPRYANTATVSLTSNENTKSVFHSHQSGTVVETEVLPANVIKQPTTYTYRFDQAPSPQDIQGAKEGTTNYVFGRGDGNVYIYNSNGVQAIIPFKTFVEPKQN